MSGVQTGTRLERLEQLLTRIKLEIELERRLNPPARPERAPAKRPARKRAKRWIRPDTAARHAARMARCEQLGVTQRQIKEWAVEQGLLDQVKRGSVAELIVEAWIQAHQHQEA